MAIFLTSGSGAICGSRLEGFALLNCRIDGVHGLAQAAGRESGLPGTVTFIVAVHPQLAPRPSLHGVLSRRAMLGVGVGLAALTAGCSVDSGGVGPGGGRSSCVARSELSLHRGIAGLPLIYEISQQRNGFAFDRGFHAQLTAWAETLDEAVEGRPDQLWTYGSWTNGELDCDSWHNSGRAFDLARVRLAGGTFVSCRFDIWQVETGGALAARLRAYWRLAASLHLHFAYVLTYLYNAQHHNHIHVDNGRSGAELSTFRSGSPAQVQAVQAICTHLWGRPLEATGRWDLATRGAVASVLDELGLPGSLADTDAWRGLLGASARGGG